MAIPFADIEAMVNAGTAALLSNATLSYIDESGDATIDGIFSDSRNEPDAIGAPRGVRDITFACQAAALGTLKAGTPVTIRDVVYAVSRTERDKTGWTVLHLRGGVN